MIQSLEQYQELYDRSINDRDGFWTRNGQRPTSIGWRRSHASAKRTLQTGKIGWFLGGKLNVSVNCLDRHLATRGDKSRILWRATSPATTAR